MSNDLILKYYSCFKMWPKYSSDIMIHLSRHPGQVRIGTKLEEDTFFMDYARF